MSTSVAQGAVLTLRNFPDDITLWGWAERPPRVGSFQYLNLRLSLTI